MRRYRLLYMPARPEGEPDPSFTVRAPNADAAWAQCPQCSMCREDLQLGYVECFGWDDAGQPETSQYPLTDPALTSCAAEWWLVRLRYRRKPRPGRSRWR